MVDSKTILAELQRRGVELRADGDELVMSVKAAALGAWRLDRIQSDHGRVLVRLRRIGQDEEVHDESRQDEAAAGGSTEAQPNGQRADERDLYAVCDEEAAQGKPTFAAEDDPLVEPESVDQAAMDLLILSYACNRRARMLHKLGPCPPVIGRQILGNLAAVDMAVGDMR